MLSTMETTIGHKIRKIREIKGLSQEYVSSKLGITQNSYSKIERGETNVDEDKLSQIATALDVDKDVIKNFSEQFIFHSCSQSGYIHTQNINPLEKIQELYGKLLAEKDSRIKLLEKVLYKGKK
jgi:transcriptional regulator with XRE-family HTH domain